MSTGSAHLRATAARAIARITHNGESLSRALPALAASDSGADRPAVQALVYGTCRWYPRLECVLTALLDRPLRAKDGDLHGLLLVGLYELFDSDTPDYAAVDAAVEASRVLGKPHASGLVNAVLRRFARERRETLDRVSRAEEARYAHPQWLVERIRRDWPTDWRAILEANNARPPMWVRVNARRTNRDHYRERLRQEFGLLSHTSAHAPQALRLDRAVSVQRLPGFTDGLVSVQDAAAQLAASLIAPPPGARVLDACAAPGGKACHLLETYPELAELVAVDVSEDRLGRIAENLERLQLEARLVLGDAREPSGWWDGRLFDRILLDAPCSATGVIRRHPDIKLLRRESDIEQIAAVQAELLEALWPLLAVGGRLVYASCSVVRAENQGVVEPFLRRHPDASGWSKSANLARPAWGHASGPGWQILPGNADMDGFFYACLTKQA